MNLLNHTLSTARICSTGGSNQTSADVFSSRLNAPNGMFTVNSSAYTVGVNIESVMKKVANTNNNIMGIFSNFLNYKDYNLQKFSLLNESTYPLHHLLYKLPIN